MSGGARGFGYAVLCIAVGTGGSRCPGAAKVADDCPARRSGRGVHDGNARGAGRISSARWVDCCRSVVSRAQAA